MKRELALTVAVCFLSLSANSQNVVSPREIYRINCKAIVQIKTEGGFGVGFLVSSDGMVMTANHVVTTRDSHFKQYASDIEVTVAGHALPYKAQPLMEAPSDESINYDSALVKISETTLPHLILGNFDEVSVGDSVTIIPSFPSFGCLLLQGIVSDKISAQTDLGARPVNVVLFQAPIRNGFSGSPIFSPKGHVIGIQDTKVFGISPALDELRSKWVSGPGKADFLMSGTSLNGSLTEVINNLDQNLISGLGSGVDISYGKTLQEKQHSH